MADDLGYECVGSYGGQSYGTPNLDELVTGKYLLEKAPMDSESLNPDELRVKRDFQRILDSIPASTKIQSNKLLHLIR